MCPKEMLLSINALQEFLSEISPDLIVCKILPLRTRLIKRGAETV